MKLYLGIVWWNAVSYTATIGTSGKAFCMASIPAKLPGWCKGPSFIKSLILWIASSSIITESEYFSPPCNTRCPTPFISSKLSTAWYLSNSSNITCAASVWFFKSFSPFIFSPLTLVVQKLPLIPTFSI